MLQVWRQELRDKKSVAQARKGLGSLQNCKQLQGARAERSHSILQEGAERGQGYKIS
jgi:hypothetical protein